MNKIVTPGLQMAEKTMQRRHRELKQAANKYEFKCSKGNHVLSYHVGRTEGIGDVQDIINIHKMSFIDAIGKRLQSQDRVVVLDVGGGDCAYAHQIRGTFRQRVRVLVTGLRKSVARSALSSKGEKLHPDDLRLQSILQLQRYPEFDFVIDTLGEANYSVGDVPEWIGEGVADEYASAVMAKLHVGGIASIATERTKVNACVWKQIFEKTGCSFNVLQQDEELFQLQKLL